MDFKYRPNLRNLTISVKGNNRIDYIDMLRLMNAMQFDAFWNSYIRYETREDIPISRTFIFVSYEQFFQIDTGFDITNHLGEY